MNILIRRLLLGIFLALATISLTTGCNTIEGAGEDLEEAGEQIEEAAEDASY